MKIEIIILGILKIKWDKSIVETNETSNLNIQPIREKLFNSDTFELSGNNCIIEHSSLRMLSPNTRCTCIRK